jgi:hypothetical protein
MVAYWVLVPLAKGRGPVLVAWAKSSFAGPGGQPPQSDGHVEHVSPAFAEQRESPQAQSTPQTSQASAQQSPNSVQGVSQ